MREIPLVCRMQLPQTEIVTNLKSQDGWQSFPFFAQAQRQAKPSDPLHERKLGVLGDNGSTQDDTDARNAADLPRATASGRNFDEVQAARLLEVDDSIRQFARERVCQQTIGTRLLGPARR